MSTRVLGPAVAGRWYAASGAELEREVDALLANAAPRPADLPSPLDVTAVIAPHAGFMYSGAVAASAFRELRDRPVERVILLGPSHYERFDGCALPDADVYRTPLGDVPIDRDAVEALRGHGGFRIDNHPFGPEHSLESELPFLQRVLPAGWRVLPLLVGAGTDEDSLKAVADALVTLLDAGTLVVVSSDFTHYGERFGYVPFTGHVEPRVRELDMRAIDHIVAHDWRGFRDFTTRNHVTICGRAAIEIALHMLPANSRGHLTAYDTSGRQTADWDNTVSYAGVLLAGDTRREPTVMAALSTEEGVTLVALARAAIADPLRSDGSLERALTTADITPGLRVPRAAFVTLKLPDAQGTEQLRGCIGTLNTTIPLFRNVVTAAPRASEHDPRFPALTAGELEQVRIEVSALTPLQPLGNVRDIELGRDGVQLERGNHRALFLPQVGSERDWTVEQFLDNLSLKAGLARGDWREATLSVFRVEAFRE